MKKERIKNEVYKSTKCKVQKHLGCIDYKCCCMCHVSEDFGVDGVSIDSRIEEGLYNHLNKLKDKNSENN